MGTQPPFRLLQTPGWHAVMQLVLTLEPRHRALGNSCQARGQGLLWRADGYLNLCKVSYLPVPVPTSVSKGILRQSYALAGIRLIKP